MNALNLLISLVVPVGLGYALLSVMSFGRSMNIFFKLALSFGLGTGLLSQWMLVLGIMKIPFSSASISIPLVVLMLVLTVISFLMVPKLALLDQGRAFETSFRVWDVLMLFYVGYYVFYIFWRGFHIPISTWDAFATNTFNAKVLYYERGFTFIHHMPRNTYPMHIPLLQMWLSINWGSWNGQFVKMLFPCYSFSFLIIYYFFLRNYTSKRWALWGLALLVSANFFIFHSAVSYRDFTIMYYNCSALMLLLIWHKKRSDLYLILAGLFSGFTTFVKSEGTVYLLILSILFLVLLKLERIDMKHKVRQFFKFILPSFSICFFYHLIKIIVLKPIFQSNPKSHSFTLYSVALNVSDDVLSRFGIVINRIVNNLFFTSNWNLVWLLFFTSLFVLRRGKISLEIKMLLFALVLYFGLYIALFTLTQHFYWVDRQAAALSRCILHIFPLAPLLIVLINFSDDAKKLS